jgi:hypothetical protein
MRPVVRMDIDTYRKTAFDHPEPHFLNGELEPRAMPEWMHSVVVGFLIEMFARQGLRGAPECRIWITPDRIRVVDLAVVSRTAKAHPHGEITNPLAIIEVLPEGQSIGSTATAALCADCESVGIPVLVVLDPVRHNCWYYQNEHLKIWTRPTFSWATISIDLAALWNELGQAASGDQ